MPRVTRRGSRIRIWVPPEYTTIYRLTVTRKDDSVDDLTDLAHLIEIEDGATEQIGQFKFEVWNPNETYSEVWTGMEVVRYYSDYDNTASSLRFRGRIEKVSYQNNKVVVSGRSEALYFLNITVTQTFTTTDCADILRSLNSIYGGGNFTETNIADSGVELTINWTQKPFWDCVQELARASGFDVYVDADLDWHFFKKGSVVNNGEGIMFNYNLLGVTDFGQDLKQISNRVIVYGAAKDGIQIIHTAEDTPSQSANFVREKIINDDNVTNQTQAEELADYWLSKLQDGPTVGGVKGTLLASIQPGEKIWVGSPANTLNQGTYSIAKYKHTIGASGLFTQVTLENSPRQMSDVIKNMVMSTSEQRQTSINPEEMRYSYNFFYDEDVGVHSNTEITDSVLKLQSGQSSGNWVSPVKTHTTDISEVYVLGVGETLTGVVFHVSLDGGLNYDVVGNKEKRTTFSSSGKKLMVKAVFSDADTQVDSLAVMFK